MPNTLGKYCAESCQTATNTPHLDRVTTVLLGQAFCFDITMIQNYLCSCRIIRCTGIKIKKLHLLPIEKISAFLKSGNHSPHSLREHQANHRLEKAALKFEVYMELDDAARPIRLR